ncbi:hypothetical protein [Actinoplanes sp. NPDC026623]|uniref:hypothetical protein n=1 Tax=Actinoplanes sp. NPDC026623 TaxID=3155610 RepID=UPI0033C9634D
MRSGLAAAGFVSWVRVVPSPAPVRATAPTLIWLVDVAGRTREDAAETVRGTAQALLAALLADAGR